MHEKVILFSQDKNFVQTCNLALPASIQILLINRYQLLENCLQACNQDDKKTVIMDWNGDFTLRDALLLEKASGHHFFYFSTSISDKKIGGGVQVRILPFDLSKLVQENPELFTCSPEGAEIKTSVFSHHHLSELIGHSPVMVEIRRKLSVAAAQNCSVLLTGESGTGKSLAASIIHYMSGRARRPLVMENVAAISETLAESELFGSAKGSYTGSEKNRKGLFGEADGSTLFLDEIGELSLTMQSKLLQALQEKTVRPVGEEKSRKIDVRTIFATNTDLRKLIKRKLFREDLYFRINHLEIRMPSLRERLEDIPELCHKFFQKERIDAEITGQALKKMMKLPWRGNIRELETVLRRAIIYGSKKGNNGYKSLILDLPLLEFCRKDLLL